MIRKEYLDFAKQNNKEISKDVLAVWEISKKMPLSSNLLEIIQGQIRQARNALKDDGESCPLERKAKQFPREGDWLRSKVRELTRKVYDDKVTVDADLGKWVSVEIECIFDHKTAEDELVYWIRKAGYTNLITIKDDGSIHPDEYECDCPSNDDGDTDHDCERPFGRELVFSFKYGDWAMLTAVCDKLRTVGATVNKSCGLHVHFDCRHLSPNQVMSRGKKVAKLVPILKTILPRSRRDNEFCRTNINSFMEGRSRERYAFVNLMSYNKHKTLEIRGHSGTTDSVKIVNWIKLIYTIMNSRTKRGITPPTNVAEMITTLKLEPMLGAYIISRFERFNKASYGDDVANDNENTAVGF